MCGTSTQNKSQLGRELISANLNKDLNMILYYVKHSNWARVSVRYYSYKKKARKIQIV